MVFNKKEQRLREGGLFV